MFQAELGGRRRRRVTEGLQQELKVKFHSLTVRFGFNVETGGGGSGGVAMVKVLGFLLGQVQGRYRLEKEY